MARNGAIQAPKSHPRSIPSTLAPSLNRRPFFEPDDTDRLCVEACDGLYLGGWGSLPACRCELLDCVRRPDRKQFDRSVAPVADPSAKPETQSAPLRPPSIANALDPSFDDEAGGEIVHDDST